MRFKEKDFDIPQVCLDLGFEDRSYHKERSAQMYNPELDLTLWVYGQGVDIGKNRYVLQDCGNGIIREVQTDDELRKLVARFRGKVYSRILDWEEAIQPSLD